MEKKSNKRPNWWKRIGVGFVLFAIVLLLLPLIFPIFFAFSKRLGK